jgi:hypothetical protein
VKKVEGPVAEPSRLARTHSPFAVELVKTAGHSTLAASEIGRLRACWRVFSRRGRRAAAYKPPQGLRASSERSPTQGNSSPILCAKMCANSSKMVESPHYSAYDVHARTPAQGT